jgi:hypothetical protein
MSRRMAPQARNATVLAKVNRRWAKIAMGRIGDAVWRCQTRKTASPSCRLAPWRGRRGEEQPIAGGSVNAKMTPHTSKTTAAASG